MLAEAVGGKGRTSCGFTTEPPSIEIETNSEPPTQSEDGTRVARRAGANMSETADRQSRAAGSQYVQRGHRYIAWGRGGTQVPSSTDEWGR